MKNGKVSASRKDKLWLSEREEGGETGRVGGEECSVRERERKKKVRR